MWKTHKFFQKTQKTQNNNKNLIHMRTTDLDTFSTRKEIEDYWKRDLALRLYMNLSEFSRLKMREIFYALDYKRVKINARLDLFVEEIEKIFKFYTLLMLINKTSFMKDKIILYFKTFFTSRFVETLIFMLWYMKIVITSVLLFLTTLKF